MGTFWFEIFKLNFRISQRITAMIRSNGRGIFSTFFLPFFYLFSLIIFNAVAGHNSWFPATNDNPDMWCIVKTYVKLLQHAHEAWIPYFIIIKYYSTCDRHKKSFGNLYKYPNKVGKWIEMFGQSLQKLLIYYFYLNTITWFSYGILIRQKKPYMYM